MKKVISLILISGILLWITSNSVFAISIYAGAQKNGSQKGIAAHIKTPTSLPTLGDNGESCWVSNYYYSDPYSNWVQTGLRYYSGYTTLRTYVEHNINGDYGLQEVGFHSLNFSVLYKVSYESDSKWHAYIANVDQGSWSMNSTAIVMAKGESHASNTQLGPFKFTQVTYKNSSNSWVWNDSAPIADSPYYVDIIDNANYTIR